MRYAKPDANAVARFSVKFIPGADFGGGAITVLVGLGSLGFSIPMAIMISPFFSVFGLISLFVLYMYVSYFTQSIKVGKYSFSNDVLLDRASPLWDKIRGEFTEQLALPIMQKIYDHSAAGRHEASVEGYYGSRLCESCLERIDVLTQLVPDQKRPTDKSDIRDALNFIKARKEIGG